MNLFKTLVAWLYNILFKKSLFYAKRVIHNPAPDCNLYDLLPVSLDEHKEVIFDQIFIQKHIELDADGRPLLKKGKIYKCICFLGFNNPNWVGYSFYKYPGNVLEGRVDGLVSTNGEGACGPAYILIAPKEDFYLSVVVEKNGQEPLRLMTHVSMLQIEEI